MAVPANTFQTYQNSDNIKESVSDIISNIDPHEKPFVSAIGTGSAQSTREDWLTDTLASAGANAQIEGDDTTAEASSKATRVGNYTQIMKKSYQISGTDETVSKYGRASEKNYQKAKKLKELGLDQERACIGVNQAAVAGDASTARQHASVQAWIATNTSISGTGSPADPTGDGTDARTDGDQRAFTEALLTGVLETCYTNGAMPSMLLASPYNRSVFSGFSGNADQVQHGNEDKRVVATAKVYEGDFHTLTVMPSRELRSRDVLLIDPSYWEILYLRPAFTEKLAKTGDSEKEHVIMEYTLKSRNQKANGGIFDLTTAAA